MPGRGGLSRVYYDFPNGTPWTMKAMFALLFANFAGSFAVTFWAEHYGGVAVFVPSWLGIYEHWSFWLHFVFLGLIGLMLWAYVQKGHAVRVR